MERFIGPGSRFDESIMNADFNRICRLCLKICPEFIDLRPSNGTRDGPRQIVEKIKYCYAVMIDVNEPLPTKVCLQCIHILTLLWATKKNIRTSEVLLRNIMNIRNENERLNGNDGSQVRRETEEPPGGGGDGRGGGGDAGGAGADPRPLVVRTVRIVRSGTAPLSVIVPNSRNQYLNFSPRPSQVHRRHYPDPEHRRRNVQNQRVLPPENNSNNSNNNNNNTNTNNTNNTSTSTNNNDNHNSNNTNDNNINNNSDSSSSNNNNNNNNNSQNNDNNSSNERTLNISSQASASSQESNQDAPSCSRKISTSQRKKAATSMKLRRKAKCKKKSNLINKVNSEYKKDHMNLIDKKRDLKVKLEILDLKNTKKYQSLNINDPDGLIRGRTSGTSKESNSETSAGPKTRTSTEPKPETSKEIKPDLSKVKQESSSEPIAEASKESKTDKVVKEIGTDIDENNILSPEIKRSRKSIPKGKSTHDE